MGVVLALAGRVGARVELKMGSSPSLGSVSIRVGVSFALRFRAELFVEVSCWAGGG